jgi:hypothetical protein
VIAVDTNILIYAHREEVPEHVSALAWLTRLAEDPLLWGMSHDPHEFAQAEYGQPTHFRPTDTP